MKNKQEILHFFRPTIIFSIFTLLLLLFLLTKGICYQAAKLAALYSTIATVIVMLRALYLYLSKCTNTVLELDLKAVALFIIVVTVFPVWRLGKAMFQEYPANSVLLDMFVFILTIAIAIITYSILGYYRKKHFGE
jgi:hypothetical protein